MSGRRSKKQFIKSDSFESLDPDVEQEILDIYAEVTDITETGDFTLAQLPEMLDMLRIPSYYINDMKEAVEYYYEFMHNREWNIKSPSLNQGTVLDLLGAYTISGIISTQSDIIDIVDIDKLIKNLNRLIKFRNADNIIREGWYLFVRSATSSASSGSTSNLSDNAVLSYVLSLPDLKNIKANLNLDESREGKSLGDSFLIDMLSCGSRDLDGHRLNYRFDRAKFGPGVSIKEFADILGSIGELD